MINNVVIDRPVGVVALGVSVFFNLGASAQVLNQSEKLLPEDGGTSDQFGWSVAIDDGVVAVGSVFAEVDGVRSGAVYLFDPADGAQSAKLVSDDNMLSDAFGAASAIDGGLLAVGAPFRSENIGVAYLFETGTGDQSATLLPSGPAAPDLFGIAIDIHDGVVAVGASRSTINGSDSGAAFLLDAATGQQLHQLLPDDGAAGDFFGESIAIGGGLVAIGALGASDNGQNSGSAYLFDVATGAQVAKLLPDDGAAGDTFGFAIAIDNGIVVIGARNDEDNGSDAGSVYLFDAASGQQLAKLLANDGAERDRFGSSVALDGGIIAVGAPNANGDGSGSGSAYLFEASTGEQLAKLVPDDGAGARQFGFSIAIWDGMVVVGAPVDDENGPASGAAYLFDTNPCSPADLAFPPGVLDFSDVSTFLAAFGAMDPVADLAPPLGVLDFSDAVIFLTAFGAGCP